VSIYHEQEWQDARGSRYVSVEVVRERVVYEYLDLLVEVEHAVSEHEATKAAWNHVEKSLQDDLELKKYRLRWERDCFDEEDPDLPYINKAEVVRNDAEFEVDCRLRLRESVPEFMPVEGNLELPFTWD